MRFHYCDVSSRINLLRWLVENSKECDEAFVPLQRVLHHKSESGKDNENDLWERGIHQHPKKDCEWVEWKWRERAGDVVL